MRFCLGSSGANLSEADLSEAVSIADAILFGFKLLWRPCVAPPDVVSIADAILFGFKLVHFLSPIYSVFVSIADAILFGFKPTRHDMMRHDMTRFNR